MYAQNDFSPAGAVLKTSPNQHAERVREYGPEGNDALRALGFVGVGNAGDTVLYSNNPDGAKGEAWVLVKDPNTEAMVWVSGSAIRTGETNFDEQGRDETLENLAEVKDSDGRTVVAGLEECELTPAK